MPEAAGARLGPFRIIEPIGSGGFATVYLARDERLDSDVAIKVLAENHSLDADIRARFLREARLLRRVASDHIVGVLDIGETERLQPYMVLELAAGGDLRERVQDRLEAGEQVSLEDVVVVAHAVAAALDAVHAHDIVHRDVSPANLLIVTSPSGRIAETGRLLAPDERLVLADLGLAKDLGQHSGLTMGGGTQGFAAPQQRQGFGTIDHRADIYAASAVLAWMHTGTAPDQLGSDDPVGIADQLREARVPPSLAEVLARGLAADPDARQRDVATWRSEVLDALHPPPLPASAPSAPETGRDAEPPAVPSHPERRRPWWIGAAAALVLILAGAAAGVALVDRSDEHAERTELDDGRVRVQRSEGDIVAAIFGPATVAVGEPATFEAGVVGGLGYAWVTPDGAIVEGVPSIDITAAGPGAASIGLVVTTGGGEPLAVELELEVVGR